jgi:hypothetical protein
MRPHRGAGGFKRRPKAALGSRGWTRDLPFVAQAVLSTAQTLAAKINVQACATFTREGLSLRAIVTPQAVEIGIGASNSPVALPFPSGSGPRPRTYYQNCHLLLNRAQDEATSALPSETPRGRSSISLVIARLDLKQVRWSKPLRLDPPPALQTYYRNDLDLIGYREDSSELMVVASTTAPC